MILIKLFVFLAFIMVSCLLGGLMLEFDIARRCGGSVALSWRGKRTLERLALTWYFLFTYLITFGLSSATPGMDLMMGA